MSFPAPGRHPDLAAFLAHWRATDPGMGAEAVVPGPAGPLARPSPIALRGRVPGNRFCVQPMEGWDAERDGRPTADTLRRWRRFGESGAKLVWGGEAFAVCREGRANPRQLFFGEPATTRAVLVDLLEALRAGHRDAGLDDADLAVGLQLTHSGRFSRPDGAPAPLRVVARPELEAQLGVGADAPILDDAALARIADRFVALAVLARDAGFDFVDVKCCHGYLLHELLGAREREGNWGGSLERRSAYVLEIIERIRAAAPELEVGVRLSAADLAPFGPDPVTGVGRPREERDGPRGFGRAGRDPIGWDLEEPAGFLRRLVGAGTRLVNLTLGSPYYNPHAQRPAAHPPSDGYLPPEDPLVGVARHLRLAREIRAANPDLVLVGTGYSYLQEWLGAVAQHEVRRGAVDFVGLGRMMLVYPEIVRDLLEGRPLVRRRICRTFSDCTTAARLGLPSGCYPLDDHYRSRAEDAARVRSFRRSSRGGED
ncbi:MAG: NADH:flavin oxidoreductase [Planctomycetota bacterium]